MRLFIDEGMLGKIIFHNINDFELIKVKIKFYLEDDIYNDKTIEENIKTLKKDMKFTEVTTNLVQVRDYSKSAFQLDRKILGKEKLPFFDEYSPRYDLEVYLSKTKAGKKEEKEEEKKSLKDRLKKSGLGFKIKIDLNKGFIPMIRYYKHDLGKKGDFFHIGASTGIMYGLNGVFDEPPFFTFFNTSMEYHFWPMLKNYFTARISTSIHWTMSSRKELGILSYEFWKFDAILAPGIVVKKIFKLYYLLGEEIITFVNGRADTDPANILKYPDVVYPVNVNKRTDYFTLTGVELWLEFIPIRIGNPLERNFFFIYKYYFPEKNLKRKSFNELSIGGQFDFELPSMSIYSLQASYDYLWDRPPFHHHAPVSSFAFKGLGGYYSKHVGSISNEYRISIYRDYIYIGLFIDMTLFKGLGYEVSGLQYAFVTGPTIRFLIMGQFELYFHYGAGYLATDDMFFHGFNFGFQRRW